MRLRTAIQFAVLPGLGLSAFATPAVSQVELPGIHVEGATLAGKSAPKASPQPGSEAAPRPDDAPSDTVGGIPLDKVGSAVTVITGEQLRAQ